MTCAEAIAQVCAVCSSPKRPSNRFGKLILSRTYVMFLFRSHAPKNILGAVPGSGSSLLFADGNWQFLRDIT